MCVSKTALYLSLFLMLSRLMEIRRPNNVEETHLLLTMREVFPDGEGFFFTKISRYTTLVDEGELVVLDCLKNSPRLDPYWIPLKTIGL